MSATAATSNRSGSQALITAARLVSFTLICAILYWGKAIFVPVALAILLSFILSPLVRHLERWRLPRLVAVIAVALTSTAAIGGLLWMVATQLSDFAEEVPAKRDIIKEKLADIRGMSRGGSIDAIQEAIESVTEEIEHEAKDSTGDIPGTIGPVLTTKATTPAIGDRPVAVTVVPKPELFNWNSVKALTPVVASVGQVALVFILVILLLISEEDLRGRIVSIAGDGRLAVTTHALYNAGTRISNYLSTQLILNGIYGVAVTVGLYFLGVPYAILWGVCAALFRYIPYVGPWAAALLPLTTTLLSSPGWKTVGAVLVLFVVLELISNNVFEPWLYGKSVGIPAFILLITAIFWTWIWGPVGLVLSTPLTVCVVALAEHVEPLRFLARLLGSESQLAPHLLLYQRLLAHDDDGASTLITNYRNSQEGESSATAVGAVSREVIAPVLSLIKRDVTRETLHEDEKARILAQLEEEINALTETHTAREGVATGSRILLCPAFDDIDEAAAKLLSLVLKTAGVSCSVISHTLLASEVHELAVAQSSRLACIVSVAPGGVATALRLCKRLSLFDNQVDVAVNHWGGVSDASRSTLEKAGARHVAEGLSGGQDLLAPMDQFFASQRLTPSLASAS